MKIAIAFFTVALSASPSLASASPPQAQESGAAAIGRLMQDWQSRILAQDLPVEDAKNWSRRNLAKFSRLNGERLSLAQRAATLGELELVLMEAPIPAGSRLDVLLASQPADMTMMGARSVAKSSPATSPSSYSNLVFTAVTTCRIYDSRPSQGGAGAWVAGSSNNVKIGPYSTAGGGYAAGPGAQGGSASSCGLDTLAGPGQIAVIMAAVSTVSQSGSGYLTFYPQGAPNPGLTSVSQFYQPGYVQTSFVMIPTDLVGTVAASAFTSASTDVIIDVVGYFIANAGNGNITLVDSTATAGNVLKEGIPFIHNFGIGNTFIGTNSGNFTMSGFANTASGNNALAKNTTGNGNTASGAGALYANTTGGSNTASGESALATNTTGTGNTASGQSALGDNATGDNNTASGAYVLPNNTSGASNTAHGAEALFVNVAGNNNTAIGFQALYNLEGSNNIALGNGAGGGIVTGNSNIHIGNGGTSESNTIRIGALGSHARTFLAGIRGVTTGANDAIAVVIDSDGQLGTVSSSRRFKDDIADMDAASSALMKLRPVTFHYKSDQNASGRTLQYGLIAEEVAEIYPGLVAHSADGQIETVMYQFLPPMLLNELQKQRRIIAELKQDRDLQKARVDALEKSAAQQALYLERILATVAQPPITSPGGRQ